MKCSEQTTQSVTHLCGASLTRTNGKHQQPRHLQCKPTGRGKPQSHTPQQDPTCQYCTVLA
ncbi:hypothetical protein E2C01_060498 [Portunus trituberculatus]|uniref:Uncharacterized protein n=1 Tax=Portunus trituberculatus TaxID=210409 RepID=A0A5B7H2N7_PORTR|nr:hypothetical protein [Portunus trituberculatus]